jgi:hypothetical protein
MTDEPELDEFNYSDDVEYEEPENIPHQVHAVRAFLGVLGSAILAAAAGYFLGWGVAIVLDRIANRS